MNSIELWNGNGMEVGREEGNREIGGVLGY